MPDKRHDKPHRPHRSVVPQYADACGLSVYYGAFRVREGQMGPGYVEGSDFGNGYLVEKLAICSKNKVIQNRK